MDVFELKEWFSVTDAAARLTGIMGRPVTTDDVLNYLIDGRLQASIRSRQVFATPLVSMTQEEAKSFVGTSWTTPAGVRIGATWETVVLAAIKPVLDLSVCRGCGEFVDDVRSSRLDIDG